MFRGRADYAFENAGIAEGRHMGKQHADIIEPPAFERSRGIIRAVPEFFHGLFYTVLRFGANGGAAVRDA